MKETPVNTTKDVSEYKTKILVVDDHPIMRIGVGTILSENESLSICGEAIDGADAIKQVKEKTPDIVIMDITMPGISGIDATKEIVKKHPEVKIIALSIHSGEKFVKEMLDAGAMGYLLKDEAAEELLTAIEKVSKGEMYLSSAVTKTALKGDYPDANSIHIMKTKLLRPLLSDQFVSRERIIGELEHNMNKPVSIVSAGPGYGKSIAVSQWLEVSNYPHGWITLDHEHDDLRTFLLYLKSAVETVFPGALRETGKAITGFNQLPIDKILYILFNDLCDLEKEMILVLDDYHKISDNTIHHLFDEWLHLPPPNIHLCIITRRDPPLSMEILRATGRIGEIRMNLLSFNTEEIHQLFQQLSEISLDDHAVEALYEKTEGWIVALRLASMSIRRNKDFSRVLVALDGGLKSISDYMIAETLLKLPEKMKQLLLTSSLLNRFSTDLLEAMDLGSDEITAIEFMGWLKKSNMFLIQLDVEGNWYRFHHLFQSLLYDQLRKEQSEESINELHRKVSLWLEDNQFLNEAVYHSIQVKDYVRTKEIIKNHRIRLLNDNNWLELGKLVEQLPKSIIYSDIDLILSVAYSLIYKADFTELPIIIEKLEALNVGPDKESLQFGELNFFKGYTYFAIFNKMDAAKQCLDLAQDILTQESGEPYALTTLYGAIVSQILGQHQDVHKDLDKKIRESKNAKHVVRNRLYSGYLMSSMAEADLVSAEKFIFQGVRVARNSEMVDSIGVSLMLAGIFYLRKGEWNPAYNYLGEVLEKKFSIQMRAVLDSMTASVLAQFLAGKRIKSYDLLKHFQSYIKGMGDYYYQFLWSCQLRYYALKEDKNKIRELLNPPYDPAVSDLVFWFDVPAISYCWALLFEGSEANLLRAEQRLKKLEKVTTQQHNYIHLLEVYALQAILSNMQGKAEEAVLLLTKSLQIAEPGGIISYYVELGKPIIKIIDQMDLQELSKPHVQKILAACNDASVEQEEPVAVSPAKQSSSGDVMQLNSLTQRELDVLLKVAKGMRNQEIASILCVSEDTVKKHLYNMFQKFHVKNRMSLVHKAKSDGIIS